MVEVRTHLGADYHVTTRSVELLQFAVQERMDVGFWRTMLDIREDVIADHLVFALRSYVYGNRGQVATDAKLVHVPKFPRWLPQRLQRRWTTTRTIRLDATPMVVWPDATWAPPHMGAPIQLVSVSTTDDDQRS